MNKTKNENAFFSIVLVTYNSDWNKTRKTLNSILSQSFKDYEIIVADDGSKETNYDLFVEYFNKKQFYNYILVKSEYNRGTVKNIINALNYCNGKFLKLLSPGDFFYNTDTLVNIYNEIDNYTASIYLTRYVFYNSDNGTHIYLNKMFPKDIRPYKNDDYQKIKRNYLINLDLILGAAIIYKSSDFKKYILDIAEYVKYAEDTVMLYMISSNEKIKFLNVIGGWYEYSTGISTTDDEKWIKAIQNDINGAYLLLYKKQLIPEWLYELRVTKRWWKRQIIKLFHCPWLLFLRLRRNRIIKGYDYLDENYSLLEKILSE